MTGLHDDRCTNEPSSTVADAASYRSGLTLAAGVGNMPFMTDGFVVGPGEGERVSLTMTLKVGDKNTNALSMFEFVNIEPGFDVAPEQLSRLVDEDHYTALLTG